MNRVILCGRLTREPEVRYSQTANGRQATILTRTDRKFTLMTVLLKDTSSAKAVLISRVATMELWAVTAVMMALWLFQMM